MNKDWMKNLKDLSQSSTRKAPEGLLDDIKKEMSRRGVMPVAQPKKARFIGIFPQRIIAVAAIVLFIVGTTIYLKLDTWNVQQQISKINSKDSKIKGEEETLTNEQDETLEKADITNRLSLCAQNSQDSKIEDKVVSLNDEIVEMTKEDDFSKSNINQHSTSPSSSVSLHQQANVVQRKMSLGVYYGNMASNNANTGLPNQPVYFYANAPIASCDNQADNLQDAVTGTYVLASPTITNANHHQPIRFGLSVSVAINNRWSVLTGLTYSYLRSDFDSHNNIKTTESKQKLHYIGIPLNMSYSILKKNNFNLYLIAGGQAEKLVKGKTETTTHENNLPTKQTTSNLHENKLVFSTNASAGVEYQIGKFLSLYAEPGISYYFKNGSGIESNYTDKPLNFNFNVGIRIR